METIKGTVSRVVFSSEETGYKVLQIRTVSGSPTIITGEFGPEIIPGTAANFHGNFKTHAKYGTQFRVTSIDITFNAEEQASIRLFIDNIAPQIGRERSGAITRHFGADTIRVLDEEPERLQEVEGIGKVSAKSLSEAWKSNREKWNKEREIYSLRAFLYSLGLKERRVKRVLATFGGGLEAEELIRSNPYSLTAVDGFGFTTVDFIAKQLGVKESDPHRFEAFVEYLIHDICPSNGHLYLTAEEVLELSLRYCKENCTLFLGKPGLSASDVNETLQALVREESVEIDGSYIYSPKNLMLEKGSASTLTRIMSTKSDLIFLNNQAVDEYIQWFETDTGMILSEEQRKAMHYFVDEKVFIITGGPGTGKCLGRDTPVMMYDGTIKKVQEIRTGELLMGDDSTPRRVLSTCKGEEELFRVTPVKGDSYVVNKPHILSLKESGGTRGIPKGTVSDIPLEEYFNLTKKRRHHLKGYRVGVSWSDQPVPLDPYLIGFWLGNGETEGTRISTPFLEVVQHLDPIVRSLGLSIKKLPGDNVDWDITCDRSCQIYQELEDKRQPNIFLSSLRDMGLIGNKHIPHIYKCNSEETRLKVLAGIVDSDGCLDHAGNYDVVFKIRQLAEDTVFLARSIGLAAYMKPCKKSWGCVRKGKHYSGIGDYFRICISGDISKIPGVVVKRQAKDRKQIKNVLVTGIKITPEGVGEYYGFELDGNGRFLLGDFTVTHNTTLLRAIVGLAQKMSLNLTCMTPTGISAKKLALTIGYDAYTIHRRLGFRGNEWVHNENNPYETDLSIIDEACLPYRQFVDLADGTKRYIGTIVNNKQTVEVMSFNHRTGQIEPRSITGWFKYAHDEDQKLLCIRLSRVQTKQNCRILRCTERHKIFTQRGELSANQVKLTDRVRVRGRFLNRLQKSFLLGSLLGDSHARNRHNYVDFTHGQNQLEYLNLKKVLFDGSPIYSMRGGYKPEKRLFRFHSPFIDDMDEINALTYPNGRKTVSISWLNSINEIGLAAWYMDDGSMQTQKSRYGIFYSVLLHTEGFSKKECQLICSWLYKYWDIKATVYRNKKHYFIRMHQKSSYRFWKIIEPWCITSMKYKFPPDFNPTFVISPQKYEETSYYKVQEISKFTSKGNTRKFVYDICVDENHNYFTNGVLVSNSMVDQEVLYRFLSAMKPSTHIIFVGDQDQLPSVSAGNVLRELIGCGGVPTVKLEKIFRQDEASDIIKVAHRIRHGDSDLSLFKEDPKADVFLIRMKDPSEIESFVVRMAKKFKSEKRSFQIITPRNEGPMGVEPLNAALQMTLNPEDQEPQQMNVGRFILRKGDRIIVRKNDYDLEVFNGDIGKVIAIGGGKISIMIDGRIIELMVEEAEEKLRLAYAITVHRSQGLEYPYIILPFINQFGRNMLQRNLLYTAITRAKEKVIVIGHGSALERAINNASVSRRNTRLGERILECLKKEEISTQPSPCPQADYQSAELEKELLSSARTEELQPTDTTNT